MLIRLFGCVVGASLCLTGSANAAENQWRFVTQAVSGQTQYIVQVELTSLEREGSRVRYWLRFLSTDALAGLDTVEEMLNPVRAIARGPSLYQNDCSTGQSRIIQGRVIIGYDGPVVPLERPGDWEFIAPDSLLDVVHTFVCNPIPPAELPQPERSSETSEGEIMWDKYLEQ